MTDGDALARASADALLRISEARYRRLFEAAQDGILLLNAETAQIEDANPYLIQLLGYSHAEMLGRKLWEVGAFADIQKNSDMFAQLQTAGYARYDDLPLKTKAGALINVEFVSNAYDCEGVRVIQCNVRNITEQRRAEDAVRKLSLVVEQSLESIVISGLHGDIEYVNDAFLRNSGFGQDDIVGRNVQVLHRHAMSAQADAALQQALSEGQTWTGEFQSRRKDGSEFTESAVVAPIRQDDGTTSHYVTITQDVTQLKRDAEELERHRHQLEALVQTRTHELQSAKRAAEAANVAKSAFLANMSHELRTPLVAITGMAYLIRRSGVTPKQGEYLAMLESGGRHLLELINAVLDLSKIEAGKLALERDELNLTAIAAAVVAIVSGQAAAKNLVLSVEVLATAQPLQGDAARLQQALLNYAANAVKFTDAGSVGLRVVCDSEDADSMLVRFEVQDSGIGISARELPRLFAAFEQADNSITRRHGGTGLGLAIVRQLAQLMGGDVGARSELGVGSTFWFTARLHKLAQSTLPAPEAPHAGSAEDRLRQAHPDARILLVDDEAVSRAVTQELLAGVTARVDVAHDGAEAVSLAQARRYDLILMDVQMSGIDGIAATRLIRQLPGGGRVPIVALTANAFAEDRQRCLDAGMDAFLAKPCHPDALFETLLQWLGSGRHHRP
jgi:two-component system, sensor histidine kinase and response regulator